MKKVVLLALSIILMLSLTACFGTGGQKDVVTVDEKLAALQEDYAKQIAALKAQLDDCNLDLEELAAKGTLNAEAIDALNAAYTAKVAELETAATADKEALEALTAAYTAKVAELVKADESNKNGFNNLAAQYLKKVKALEEADAANKKATADLKADYEKKVSALSAADAANAKAVADLKADYEKKAAELAAADAENAKAVADLNTEFGAAVEALVAADAETAEELAALQADLEVAFKALVDADAATDKALAELKAEYTEKVVALAKADSDLAATVEGLESDLNDAVAELAKESAQIKADFEELAESYTKTAAELKAEAEKTAADMKALTESYTKTAAELKAAAEKTTADLEALAKEQEEAVAAFNERADEISKNLSEATAAYSERADALEASIQTTEEALKEAKANYDQKLSVLEASGKELSDKLDALQQSYDEKIEALEKTVADLKENGVGGGTPETAIVDVKLTYDFDEDGNQITILTVTYGNGTTNTTVTKVPKKVIAIDYEGTSRFNVVKDGGEIPQLFVTVTYEDYSSDIIAVTDDMFVVDEVYQKPDFTKAGTYRIHLKYRGAESNTYTIQVIDPDDTTPTEIQIMSQPETVVVQSNGDLIFNLSDFVFRIRRANLTFGLISGDDPRITLDTSDFTVAGEKLVVKVTYQEEGFEPISIETSTPTVSVTQLSIESASLYAVSTTFTFEMNSTPDFGDLFILYHAQLPGGGMISFEEPVTADMLLNLDLTTTSRHNYRFDETKTHGVSVPDSLQIEIYDPAQNIYTYSLTTRYCPIGSSYADVMVRVQTRTQFGTSLANEDLPLTPEMLDENCSIDFNRAGLYRLTFVNGRTYDFEVYDPEALQYEVILLSKSYYKVGSSRKDIVARYRMMTANGSSVGTVEMPLRDEDVIDGTLDFNTVGKYNVTIGEYSVTIEIYDPEINNIRSSSVGGSALYLNIQNTDLETALKAVLAEAEKVYLIDQYYEPVDGETSGKRAIPFESLELSQHVKAGAVGYYRVPVKGTTSTSTITLYIYKSTVDVSGITGNSYLSGSGQLSLSSGGNVRTSIESSVNNREVILDLADGSGQVSAMVTTGNFDFDTFDSSVPGYRAARVEYTVELGGENTFTFAVAITVNVSGTTLVRNVNFLGDTDFYYNQHTGKMSTVRSGGSNPMSRITIYDSGYASINGSSNLVMPCEYDAETGIFSLVVDGEEVFFKVDGTTFDVYVPEN